MWNYKELVFLVGDVVLLLRSQRSYSVQRYLLFFCQYLRALSWCTPLVTSLTPVSKENRGTNLQPRCSLNASMQSYFVEKYVCPWKAMFMPMEGDGTFLKFDGDHLWCGGRIGENDTNLDTCREHCISQLGAVSMLHDGCGTW